MSIIEEASKRLEQLRQAGVDLPWDQLTRAASAQSSSQVAAAPVADAPIPVDPAERRTDERADGAVRASRVADLDLGMLRARGVLVPGSELSELAAEFRSIKRPLVANLSNQADKATRENNLIVVTSALPGEGKTFCAINLALSMAAEVDRTVLLVDADVLKPSVATWLGIESPQGLLDLLATSTTDLSDVLVKTNIPKFTVLPAGTPRSNSSELLAGAKMKAIFDELSSRYSDRIIIVDAPPLIPTTEARTLAHAADQVLMVVDSGHASQAVVSEAFAMIENCKRVMSILNRRSDLLRPHGNRYGYGE